MDRQEIARRLRGARERLGFTQAEVARQLGVHRPTISEIEAGRRAVTSEELYQLARIYATTIGALLEETPAHEDDALRVLFRGGDGLTPRARAAVQRFVDRCTAERELEVLLDAPVPETVRPVYHFPLPRDKLAAIRQGERVAEDERRRLDLGSEPIRSVFEVMDAQGIRIGPLEDCEELNLDGVYLETEETGASIGVNAARDQGTGLRSAFTAAHEYAHWVLRDLLVENFTFGATEDLGEVRANAFAAAFLMPRAGLRAHFERAGRLVGGKLIAVDAADLILAMDRFGVSRTALLYRLQNIGLLDAGVAELRTELDVMRLARALGLRLRRERLDARLTRLATEAWRRSVISTGRAADLLGTDLQDFRKRMHVLGIEQESEDDSAAAKPSR